MPNTYTLLETITVGAAGASSVTFNSIPQTGYTDLVIKFSGRNTADSSQTLITLNGSTSTYTGKRLYGSGSAATSDAGNTANFNPSSTDASSYTANTFGNAEIYIPNYTSSNYKSVSIDGVTENNATTAYGGIFAGLWSTTSAITSVTLAANSGSWAQYSTFSLYGVSALGVTPTKAPKATGGSIIQTDGTYWYHTFLYSGTFTPATALSCDYLVVAGGGGGGWYAGAGGGAGGLRSTVTATGGGGSLESALSLASGTGYTVTIGAGGASRTSTGTGNAGSNSVFSTITSTGGGGGGGSGNGATGGSGGGASGLGAFTGGSATSNQGFAGGSASGTTSGAGGSGGGGAGVIGGSGTNPPNETPGAGGNGVATSITGSSVTYAGGGGGAGGSPGQSGAGGTGGGGAGGQGTTVDGVSGTANTGGGGGGAWYTGRTSGAGGSGIVIVRYLA